MSDDRDFKDTTIGTIEFDPVNKDLKVVVDGHKKPIQPIEENKYRVETRTAPLGDTGDYDQWIELICPDGLTLQNYESGVELEQVQELADKLNSIGQLTPEVIQFIEWTGSFQFNALFNYDQAKNLWRKWSKFNEIDMTTGLTTQQLFEYWLLNVKGK